MCFCHRQQILMAVCVFLEVRMLISCIWDMNFLTILSLDSILWHLWTSSSIFYIVKEANVRAEVQIH